MSLDSSSSRKYEHLFEDSDSISGCNTSSSSEESELPLIKKSTINNIETDLDNNITKYNKYNDKNPMVGVTYNKSKKYYVLNYESIVDVKIVSLTTACRTIKNHISDKNDTIIKSYHIETKVLTYEKNNIIYYKCNKKYFYDIQHILYFLKIDKSQIKKYITHSFWHENKYGGYLLRELIPANKIKKNIILSIGKSTNILANLIGDNLLGNNKKYYIDCIMKVFTTNRMIETRYKVENYIVDMYVPDFDLVIEVTRLYRSNYDFNYENKRRHYIKDKLNCEFFTFDPHKPGFDIFNLISEIHEMFSS